MHNDGKLRLQTIQLQMGCGTSSQVTEQVNIPIRDLFKKDQLIGVGNHGCVYRGVHKINQQPYAVKSITQLQYIDRSMFRWRELEETLAKFKGIKHQRVIQYQYAQLTGKELSVVMKIAKQATLKKFIQKNGKSTEEFTAKIMKQVLEGLLYLHSHQLLHKDLKTSNVLIMDYSQNIKISDFCFGELYDPRLLEKDGSKECKKNHQFFRGDSLPYMAPEVILNHGVTTNSDVWSVGCIAIEMLTGKVPFSNIGNTFEQAFGKIKNSSYAPLPSDVSAECQEFLKGCLATAKSQRMKVEQLLDLPFIRQGKAKGKQQLYFELDNTSALKQQKVNRGSFTPRKKTLKQKSSFNIQNKSQKKLQKIEKLQVKPEVKAEVKQNKRYGNENHENKNPFSPRAAQSSRLNKRNNDSVYQHRQERSTNPHELSTINKQDILPQINEDQEINVVMLNNKKMKMQRPRSKKIHAHTKTQPAKENNNNGRNSLTLEEADVNDSFEETRGLGQKIDTEPTLMINDFDSSKEYFKKPLKLLKKKIQQNKIRAHNQSTRHQASGQTITNQSSSRFETLAVKDNTDYVRRLRTDTEKSREEKVINTDFAKAQRDRYMNEQLVMRRQREEEKAKWEQELQAQAKHMRMEFARRYAYPYPNMQFD